MIKIILIVLGITIVAFIAVQIFAMNSQNKIESYSYTLEKSFGTFEIRSYKASLFTSVKLPSKDYKKVSSKGFSILAEYIFGGNDKNEKISMTSPVTISLEDTMTMMFLVPKKFNKESLPKPNQSIIEFTEEPEKTVAVITFGGWANDENIQVYKKKLINLLKEEGIKHTNKFSFLGYNPPFEVFNRKNEIIVEL
tara:strand:- start:120 stop:704 length:585 start_codon:yes stop_codon:yes gene_type:complete